MILTQHTKPSRVQYKSGNDKTARLSFPLQNPGFSPGFPKRTKKQIVRKRGLFVIICTLTYFYWRKACVCYMSEDQSISEIQQKSDRSGAVSEPRLKFIGTAVAINFLRGCVATPLRWELFSTEIQLFLRAWKFKNAFTWTIWHFRLLENSKHPPEEKQGLKTRASQSITKRPLFLTI